MGSHALPSTTHARMTDLISWRYCRIKTLGGDQPVMVEMSGNVIPSKNASELAILQTSWAFGIDPGLNLLIKDVRQHLVLNTERGLPYK